MLEWELNSLPLILVVALLVTILIKLLKSASLAISSAENAPTLLMKVANTVEILLLLKTSRLGASPTATT